MRLEQQKSRFYYVLYTLMESGVTLGGALRSRFEGREVCHAVLKIQEALLAGGTMADAMHRISLFSDFESSMVHLGEQSGRMPAVFRVLHTIGEERYKRMRSLVSSLLYPMFVYCVSGPLLSVIEVFTGRSNPFQAGEFLLTWYLLPALFFYLYRAAYPVLMETRLGNRVLMHIPFWGKLQYLSESNCFCWSMSVTLQAGLGITDAIVMSAQNCVSPLYRKHYGELAQRIIQKGCSLTEAFEEDLLPFEKDSAMLMLISTGENSGKLDETFCQISSIVVTSLNGRLDVCGRVVSWVLYGAIVIYLLIQMIGVFGSYVQQLNNLM